MDFETVKKSLNLPEEDNDYVQYREDAEHVYVDIGRNPKIDALWKESFERIKRIEDKYTQALLNILHELQAEEE